MDRVRQEQQQQQNQQVQSDGTASMQPPEFSVESGKPVAQAKMSGPGYAKRRETQNWTNEKAVHSGVAEDETMGVAKDPTHTVSVSGGVEGSEVLAGDKDGWHLAASGGIKGTARAGDQGANAEGEMSGKIGVQNSWSGEYDFDFPIFGEHTELTLKPSIEAFLGVEGQAKMATIMGQLQNAGDPNAASQQFGVSMQREASVFAGAKLTAKLEAAYTWHKKNSEEYVNQISGRVQEIRDHLLLQYPQLGWLLNKVGDGAIDFIVESIFNLGREGSVNLGEAEAEVTGSAGAGAEAKLDVGISNGKVVFHAGAKATWGLGGGTNVRVGVDFLEGLLFGLVVGDQVWQAVRPHLGEILDPSMFISNLGSLWDNLTGWFSADDNVREMVKAGAHTLAPSDKRAEMIQTLMDGWTGQDDQEAIVEILEWSKAHGDVGVISGTLGKTRIIGELDGNLKKRAEAALG